MMDCSSLFLVLHTKVAHICIHVYPPVHASSCSDRMSTYQPVLLGKPIKSAPKWSGMKTHLAGSSVDSSCSSLGLSLSLQQLSSVVSTIKRVLHVISTVRCTIPHYTSLYLTHPEIHPIPLIAPQCYIRL